jgi:glutamate decarboxylase
LVEQREIAKTAPNLMARIESVVDSISNKWKFLSKIL